MNRDILDYFSTMEFTLLLALWVIIALWIGYKRNWYAHVEAPIVFLIANFAFLPINLIVVFCQYFIAQPWINKNDHDRGLPF